MLMFAGVVPPNRLPLLPVVVMLWPQPCRSTREPYTEKLRREWFVLEPAPTMIAPEARTDRLNLPWHGALSRCSPPLPPVATTTTPSWLSATVASNTDWTHSSGTYRVPPFGPTVCCSMRTVSPRVRIVARKDIDAAGR